MAITNFWQQQKAPMFLPDIGTFFNQDITLAKTLVKQLAQSGVETIKGEILHSADICLNTQTNENYYGHVSKTMIAENYRELIERKVVSLENYRTIFDYAHQLNLKVIVSVYDFVGADFAKEIGCIAIKVATSNITHQPLIEHIARLGLPMIIDTGKSSLEEILRAVSWAKDAGNSDLLIEHSPPPPPNQVTSHNLNFMRTIAHATGLPVGLSDHHSDDEMLYAATALGAIVLEKGVCADSLGDEQDSGHAIKISDVKQVTIKINNIALALGDGNQSLAKQREKNIARMGLVAKNNLKKGDKISLDNINFAFPAVGISTEHWSEVLGFIFTKDIEVGGIINWCDIRGE